MLDRDHIQDAARQQTALCRVLHDRQFSVLPHAAPFGVLLEIAQQHIHALPVVSGIGIAIRIADGNARALHAATAAVLEQLDLLSNVQGTPLARFARPAVRNLAGVEVGRVEPIFSLKG